MIKRIAMFAAALAISSVASAGVIVDTINQSEYVGWWDSYSYTHDLNDNGFALGSAVSGTIEIEIDDDPCRGFGCADEFLPEIILITIEAFDFDTGGISIFTTNFANGLEVNALAAINANGLLDITVSSLLGDFYVGNSVLTVVTAVPEPATLSLLGLGLLGLGIARRRASKV